MSDQASDKSRIVGEPGLMSADHYRDLRRKTTLRLAATYLSPVILLTVYFILQYGAFVSETERLHLRTIAESQANTLDLFMSERRVNLSNLIDSPEFHIPPTSSDMEHYLTRLRRISEAFVDIGFFDSSGVQAAYSGPFPSLEKKSYSEEKWYSDLTNGEYSSIITDIYLGFRQKPHFTIAVSRVTRSGTVVLRATLDPERLYEHISSLDGAQDVVTSIVNDLGDFQLVAASVGRPLDASPVLPPKDPRQGAEQRSSNGSSKVYGYSWLRAVDWVLIVQQSAAGQSGLLSGFRLRVLSVAAVLVLAGFIVILNRSRKRVELQKESDSTRAQLSHAAKLASVGELAAGIAHEINNPLASINEEAGLMKDMMDPTLSDPVKPEELRHYLDSIQESVFRCRDITRKLLGFVRRTDIELRRQDVHRLIDEVVDGLLGHEMSVSNINIVRSYAGDIPEILTDGNQLEQVILNILNNAIDAMDDEPGRIDIKTRRTGDSVMISIADTGKGISPEQMENIFMPFYTTKDVGKGTGLGLSVSYGIVRNLGGKITIESELGKGSKFTIVIPMNVKAR